MLILLIAMVACSSEVAWQTTEDGVFEYQRYINDANLPTLEYGDSVSLHCILKHQNKELFNSYQQTELLQIFIPSRMHRNKIEDLLTFVAEGDSLVAKVRYKEVKHELEAFGKGVNMEDEIEIHYKIVKVKTKAEIKADQETRYALKKGFESREEMLEERAYVLEKTKWIEDTLGHYQNDFKIIISKSSILDEVKAYTVQKSGGEQAKQGQKASIYYVLMLVENGKVLDNAYNRADRLEFRIGQDSTIIKGLHQAILTLSKGDKGTFLIPPTLAYGEEGSLPVVPSNAWLMAYVELVELRN
ncbi:MAG: hypothetical protein GY810_29450 [Aureispira sp.]|nr:hypothetical protein [Aureispira sp.]